MKCRICTKPLPDKKATGRPPVYCDESCRRIAEYGIRRAERRLEKLEAELFEAKVEAETREDYYGESARKRLPLIEAEISRMESRMRELIEPSEAAVKRAAT